MRRLLLALLAVLLVPLAPSLCGMAAALAAAGDVPGSKDYPGIGRFKGSVITGYEVKDFDASKLQAAPFKDGKATDERKPEGRVTRIAYRTGAGPSILEVAANFETQLAKAGFTTLLACTADDCGGIPFTEALDVLPIPQMWVDGFDYRYWAGRKAAKAARETYATVLVSKNNDEIYAELVVTEVGAIENKMIDAAAMAKGLGETGHIALYGIYFDTDKAVVKPESAADACRDRQAACGAARAAMCSSSATPTIRAHTTTTWTCRSGAPPPSPPQLAKSYGIAAARMQTAGVGLLAPVGSNATEEAARRTAASSWSNLKSSAPIAGAWRPCLMYGPEPKGPHEAHSLCSWRGGGARRNRLCRGVVRAFGAGRDHQARHGRRVHQGREPTLPQGQGAAHFAVRHGLADAGPHPAERLRRGDRRGACGDHRCGAGLMGKARGGRHSRGGDRHGAAHPSPLRPYRRSRRGRDAELARRADGPLDVYGPPAPEASEQVTNAEGDVLGSAGTEDVVKGFAQAYGTDADFRIAQGHDLVPTEAARMIGHDIARPGPEEAVTVYDRDGLKIEAFLVNHDPVGARLRLPHRLWRPRRGHQRRHRAHRQHGALLARRRSPRARGAQRSMVEMLAAALDQTGNPRAGTMARQVEAYHTTPVQAAGIAKEAGVPHLVLTHEVPPLRNALMRHMFVRGVAEARGTGDTTLGFDGLLLTLPAIQDFSTKRCSEPRAQAAKR